MVYRIMLKVSS